MSVSRCKYSHFRWNSTLIIMKTSTLNKYVNCYHQLTTFPSVNLFPFRWNATLRIWEPPSPSMWYRGTNPLWLKICPFRDKEWCFQNENCYLRTYLKYMCTYSREWLSLILIFLLQINFNFNATKMESHIPATEILIEDPTSKPYFSR